MKDVKLSYYESARGHTVALYKNEKTGRCMTVAEGEMTIYDKMGECAGSPRTFADGIKLISK